MMNATINKNQHDIGHIDNTRFISFEGVDFSGKSTQIDLLVERLERLNYKVYVMREPGGTDISERIRDILLDKDNHHMTVICELFLYSAARNQLIHERILKELRAGHFVIADRYVDSTTAYQGFGRGIPMTLIRDINQAATNGLLPGLTFILDINPDQTSDRIENRQAQTDRLESAGREFYQRVYKGYQKIAEIDPKRIKLIDARKNIDLINEEIWKLMKEKIKLDLSI